MRWIEGVALRLASTGDILLVGLRSSGSWRSTGSLFQPSGLPDTPGYLCSSVSRMQFRRSDAILCCTRAPANLAKDFVGYDPWPTLTGNVLITPVIQLAQWSLWITPIRAGHIKCSICCVLSGLALIFHALWRTRFAEGFNFIPIHVIYIRL